MEKISHGKGTESSHLLEKNHCRFDRYRKERGGKIQWLGHTSFNTDSIKTAIDNGAVGIYVCGDPTDRCVKSGRF